MTDFDGPSDRDGLVTLQAYLASGRSVDQWRREVSTQRMRRVRHGVVAVNGSPRTWRQEVRAVVLAAGDDVAAAHVTALRLLGAPAPADEFIHMIASLARQITLPGVISHRSGQLEDGDLITRDGIRCTSALRTVIDVSGALDDRTLGLAVDDLLRRRLLRLEDLRSRVARLRPAPGRSVARLRRNPCTADSRLRPRRERVGGPDRRIVDAAGLPRPTHQLRVQFGPRRYRIDIAWPDRRLFLEGNGFWLALDLVRSRSRCPTPERTRTGRAAADRRARRGRCGRFQH